VRTRLLIKNRKKNWGNFHCKSKETLHWHANWLCSFLCRNGIESKALATHRIWPYSKWLWSCHI